MDNKELNKKANDEFTNLTKHGLFESLEIINQSIKACKNKIDINFYLTQQDALNDIYGELTNSYGELISEMEGFIAGRKLAISIESSKNGGFFTVNNEKIKLSATLLNSVLSSLIRGEIKDLFKTVLLLEYKIKITTNAIQTCRSHLYIKEIKRED